MSRPLSIIETHKAMLDVIPTGNTKLIQDLSIFIVKIQDEKRPQKYYIEKHVYTDYLHVLLKHLPKRQLINSDPIWMWNCQEIFSNSFNN